jgi:hypothetical protein
MPTKESVLAALKQKIHTHKRAVREYARLGQIMRDIHRAQEQEGEREEEVAPVDQVPRQEEDQQGQQEEGAAQQDNEIISVTSDNTFDTQ